MDNILPEVIDVLADEWGMSPESVKKACTKHEDIRSRVSKLPDETVDTRQLHVDVKSACFGIHNEPEMERVEGVEIPPAEVAKRN